MATITDNDLALFCERAKTELRSTGDIGRLAWDDIVEALCKEVARLRSVSRESGDCAKLREALDEILEKIDKWRTDGTMEHWQYSQLFDIADAALAAPPRNCDRYSHDEALQVWAAENENERNGCFDEWLYHAVTEKKGGNDGNE